MSAKIEQFFALEHERRSIVIDNDFVETYQTRQVERFCHMAHAYNRLSVIVGDSGLSKTTTLELYSQRPNTYYVKCHPLMTSRTNFLKQIGLSLNFKVNGDLLTLYNRVCDEGAAGGKLILLDDVQSLNKDGKLNTTIFETIRAMHDAGIGFVICGNNEVRDSVTSTNHESFYQQFAARANILVLDPYIREHDFSRIIHSYFEGTLGKEEFQYLHNVANQYYGGLHLAKSILTLAITRGQKRNTSMSVRLLEEAAKHSISQKKVAYRTDQKGKKRNAKKEIIRDHSEHINPDNEKAQAIAS